jgi:hypothetical protein
MSSEEGKGEEAQYPTPLQIFVLSYLDHEEWKQTRKEQISDMDRKVTHHSYSSIPRRPISISIRELITILPTSVIPEMPKAEEVYNQLNLLAEDGLLEPEGRYDLESFSFSITGDGMLVIKQYLGDLSRAIKDRRVTDKDVEHAEGGIEVKKYFKELLSKILDKSQDEIVNTLFSAIRTQGIPLIVLLISLAR